MVYQSPPGNDFWACTLTIFFMATLGSNRPAVTNQSSNPTPDRSIRDEPYSVVGGWDVKYNSLSKTCYMEKVYPGNTELALGYDGNRYAMLLRTEKNVIHGDSYPFNVQFRRGSQPAKLLGDRGKS